MTTPTDPVQMALLSLNDALFQITTRIEACGAQKMGLDRWSRCIEELGNASKAVEALTALRARTEWMPIAEYKYKDGEICMFRYAEMGNRRFKLPVHYHTSSHYGDRVCTHFYRLSPPPTDAGV